jgi:predicted nucleic-acid-binding protein
VIGVDTNLLARLFVAENPSQHAIAKRFFSQRTAVDPAFVSTVVVAELVWMLDRGYGYSKADILKILSDILGSPDFVVEHRQVVEHAVTRAGETRATVADVIIADLAAANGCRSTATFDRDAAKSVPGMELVR